jgi:hypothetical protein
MPVNGAARPLDSASIDILRKFTGKRSWIPAYVKGPDRDKYGKPTVLRRPVHTTVPGMAGQEIVIEPGEG